MDEWGNTYVQANQRLPWIKAVASVLKAYRDQGAPVLPPFGPNLVTPPRRILDWLWSRLSVVLGRVAAALCASGAQNASNPG
jgi:hypothetical protein